MPDTSNQAGLGLSKDELDMLNRALLFYVECEDVHQSVWLGDYDLPRDMKLAERVQKRVRMIQKGGQHD